MKIEIDIDEKIYSDIKKGKVYSSIYDVPLEAVLAIANGTPLPKERIGIIFRKSGLYRITVNENYTEVALVDFLADKDITDSSAITGDDIWEWQKDKIKEALNGNNKKEEI